ncbi:glycosyltransferase [Alteripontixanthobacter maritimus]
MLGVSARSATLLPCAMARDTIIPPRQGGDGLVTAFHLRNAKLKNLPAMTAAMANLRHSLPNATLSVIGGGSASDVAAAEAMAGDGTTFEGAIDNAAIARRFNRASGFVMPSSRESFGLVFIEALFAGLPIAYPAGTAVDGYFDDCPFAIRVDMRQPGALENAMRTLLEDEDDLKAALAEWQKSPAAQRFTRGTIGDRFVSGLRDAIGTKR